MATSVPWITSWVSGTTDQSASNEIISAVSMYSTTSGTSVDSNAERREFDKLGIEFGGCVESADGPIGLRAEEQIPILWKALQELAEIVTKPQENR